MHLLIIIGIILVIALIFLVIWSFRDSSGSFWESFWLFEALESCEELLVALLEALFSGF